MSHPLQVGFVNLLAKALSTDWLNSRVLEVGSFDVNGSIRAIFPGALYTGVDLVKGPGVDRVCDGYLLDYESDSFDLCISCECFEHNPKWVETFTNMHRMTKPGGFVVITCASTGRFEHGTKRTSPISSPGTQSCGMDYYKNLTRADFERKINLSEFFSSYLFIENVATDLYFFGVKSGSIKKINFNADAIQAKYLEFYNSEMAKQKNARRSSVGMKMSYFIEMILFRLAVLLPDRLYQDVVVALMVLKRHLFGKRIST